MTQLTTPRRFVLSAVLALGACFEEDFDPFLPYTTSTGSSSDTGSGTADTSTGSTGDAEPVRACAAPEDVPPSLPGVELGSELEPLASGTCPTSWCVENVSCGTCCDGDPGDTVPQGTIGCCTTFGNQRWPSATGTCGGSGLTMKCVYDIPSVPGDPPRRTPMPTDCENGTQWTCPKGTHPESPNFECNYCPTEALGDFCFGASCSLCGGTTQQEY
jgi:hypothetical protein